MQTGRKFFLEQAIDFSLTRDARQVPKSGGHYQKTKMGLSARLGAGVPSMFGALIDDFQDNGRQGFGQLGANGSFD